MFQGPDEEDYLEDQENHIVRQDAQEVRKKAQQMFCSFSFNVYQRLKAVDLFSQVNQMLQCWLLERCLLK